MGFLSAKGQESAPFELLIAVIVMIFVMMFGYMAIEQMREQDCKAKINQALEEMRNAIESTVNQSSLERVSFNVPECFEHSRVRLSTIINRHVCGGACQEGREQCVLLYYQSDRYNRRVCVNIPIHAEFEGTMGGGPGAECEDRRNAAVPYKLIPFRDEDIGVPNGTYELINRTPPGHQKPIVCAYRME